MPQFNKQRVRLSGPSQLPQQTNILGAVGSSLSTIGNILIEDQRKQDVSEAGIAASEINKTMRLDEDGIFNKVVAENRVGDYWKELSDARDAMYDTVSKDRSKTFTGALRQGSLYAEELSASRAANKIGKFNRDTREHAIRSGFSDLRDDVEGFLHGGPVAAMEKHLTDAEKWVAAGANPDRMREIVKQNMSGLAYDAIASTILSDNLEVGRDLLNSDAYKDILTPKQEADLKNLLTNKAKNIKQTEFNRASINTIEQKQNVFELWTEDTPYLVQISNIDKQFQAEELTKVEHVELRGFIDSMYPQESTGSASAKGKHDVKITGKRLDQSFSNFNNAMKAFEEDGNNDDLEIARDAAKAYSKGVSEFYIDLAAGGISEEDRQLTILNITSQQGKILAALEGSIKEPGIWGRLFGKGSSKGLVDGILQVGRDVRTGREFQGINPSQRDVYLATLNDYPFRSGMINEELNDEQTKQHLDIAKAAAMRDVMAMVNPGATDEQNQKAIDAQAVSSTQPSGTQTTTVEDIMKLQEAEGFTDEEIIELGRDHGLEDDVRQRITEKPGEEPESLARQLGEASLVVEDLLTQFGTITGRGPLGKQALAKIKEGIQEASSLFIGVTPVTGLNTALGLASDRGLIPDVLAIADEAREKVAEVAGIAKDKVGEFISEFSSGRAGEQFDVKVQSSDPETQQVHDVLMDKIVAKLPDGVTREDLEKLMSDIILHESKGVLDSKQGKGGPGRGLFQYELASGKGSGAGKTAMQRLFNIVGEEGLPSWAKKFFDNGVVKGDVDFSTLTMEQQVILFLADKLEDPTKTEGGFNIEQIGVLSNAEWWAAFHHKGKDSDTGRFKRERR